MGVVGWAMEWFKAAAELAPRVRAGDTLAAVARLTETLKTLPPGPFHRVLQLDFTNEPQDVAAHFDRFIRAQPFKVAAVYTETNGFDINPDCWYFSLFAYRAYGGHEDYDWLSGWDSDEIPDVVLTGMEPLQAIYDSPAFEDEAHEVVAGYCSLLVVCKFQDLIRRSIPHMRELRTPLLATSHEYDFIAEFRSATPPV